MEDREKKRERDRRYREANQEQRRQYFREYYAANTEKRKATKIGWYKRAPEEVKERNRETGRRRRSAQREAILDLLGRHCVRCGFDDPRALCVDHINGGGHKERKSSSSVDAYYKRILEVGKAEYQILCANCNAIKRIEQGEHPSKVLC